MNHTTDERTSLLQTYICQHYEMEENSLAVISGDASFRRYFRFNRQAGESLIAVDAPPELENSEPFIEIAKLLDVNDIPTPKIYHYDLVQGFYIQQDFGDQLLLAALNDESADTLYSQAIKQIVDMQTVNASYLPLYDAALLQKEMHLFTDWFIEKHLDMHLSRNENTVLETCFKLLEANALEQPQAFVHRDYHSRNLMMLDNNKLGVIDFQDAVNGPITYDLVSLLRDCYIAWPQDKIENWLQYFYKQLNTHYSISLLTRWFDLMGLQRHLKAVGIFCRLNYRDNKPSYLNDIPRTMNYIKSVSGKYPELSAFHQLVKKL